MGVDAVRGQLLLIDYLLAMGCAQLAYMPLAARFGERRVLLGALLLFGVSSLAMAAGTISYSDLAVLRIPQALGTSLCLAASRSLIRSSLAAEWHTRGFVTLATLMGIVPGVAPVLGNALFDTFGLKACFYFSGAYALAAAVLVTVWMFSTRTPRSASPAGALRMYVALARNPAFWKCASVPCFAYSAYFASVCAVPYILERLGWSSAEIALSFLPLSATYLAASQWARRFASRGAARQGIHVGLGFFVAGGLLCWHVLSEAQLSAPLFVASLSVLTFGNGFLLPLGTATTLGQALEGSAASAPALGAAQFSVAAASAFVGSQLLARGTSGFGAYIAAICALALAVDTAIRIREVRRSRLLDRKEAETAAP